MKIAMAVFNTRVSPRFDRAPAFVIATVENGGVHDRQTTAAMGNGPRPRAEWLVGMGVQTVICGGIDEHSAQLLTLNGIAICAWVSGESDDALQAFAEGRLEPMMMMGPGGRCSGRWQFRRGQGGPAWKRGGGDAMPRGDGTGPAGQGAGTGRGMGSCGAGGGKGAGRGRRQGQGTGRGQGRRGARGKGRGR